MRSRLTLALLVSILLIGTASWHRFAAPVTVSNTSTILQVEQDQATYKEILSDFTEPKSESETSTVSSEPLTNTDLIGRNLLMDYITLTQNGQATDANVANLANKYVTILPTFTQSETATYLDLKIVPNTKAGFEEYADEWAQIVVGLSQIITTNKNNPAIISKAYTDTAEKLKDLEVPNAIASNHLQLINTYLSNASGMKAYSEMESDPATGFAGLVAVNKNLNKEEILMEEIASIIKSNAI